jgi:uncharacterized membrane protein (DUF4010 family)
MEFADLFEGRFAESPELGLFRTFAVSLAIGLLIGLERERHPGGFAGLRTFALTAMLGTVVAMLAEMHASDWLLAAGLLSVGAMAVVSQPRLRGPDTDPGTTTTIALLLCFGLGAMVWRGHAEIAAPLAITITALLYFKPELRGISERLQRTDLVSILQFGVLSLMVLPVLPDRGFGPLGALNPHRIWLMVVLISGVSLAGYLALRIVGARHGAALIGLFGGLVSSTATTLLYSRAARTGTAPERLSAVVILLACAVVFGRLGALTAITAPGLLRGLWPLLLGGALPLLAAAMLAWRGFSTPTGHPVPQVGNPTELKTALSFGALYALILLLAAVLSSELGSRGLYALAAVSGLTDIDAISLSSMQLLRIGEIESPQAATVIGLAVFSNTAVKATIASAIGGRTVQRLTLAGFGASLLGIGAAIGWIHYL